MEYKNLNCPNCNKPLEYWTLSNQIECTGCKEIIQVEPCESQTPDEPQELSEEIEQIEVEA